MDENPSTEVEQISYEGVSLDASLKLLWKFLKYNGLVHTPFTNSAKENRISSTARYVFTFITTVLIAFMGVYKFVQLIIGMWDTKKMATLIPESITLLMYVSCIFVFNIISHRHRILRLFQDWKTMETQLMCCNSSSIRKITKIYYASFFICLISTIVSTLFWNVKEPESLLFLSHYPIIRDTFGQPLLYIIEYMSMYFAFIWYFSLCEMCPTIFFFHVGCAIENLEAEWKIQQGNVQAVRRIWERYESIFQLVDRANDLFGSVIAFNDFTIFSILCNLSFFVITSFKTDTFKAAIFLITIIAFVFRTVFINYLLSHLYLSCGKLERSITGLLSRKFHFIFHRDRDLLVSFLSTLQKRDMAVCPMNLYTVQPSNLLTILALIVSYLIILLQSRE